MPRLKDPQIQDLPPFEEYLAQLDLNKVAEAILTTEDGRRITEEDFEDCKRMVWEAAGNWLSRDIHDLQILGVELVYEDLVYLPGAGYSQPLKAVLDIIGIVRGRLASTEKYVGKRIIIDWKTTSNLTLDARWKERYTESWQGRIYTLIEPAELINFRGITRGAEEPDQDRNKPVSKFADIFLEFPSEGRPEVLNQITGVSLQRKSLIDQGLTIWPMNKPSACSAYGRSCPYKPTCPGEPGLIPVDKSFSYSSMSSFMLCPERYRRGVLEALGSPGESIDGSEESRMGNSFHRGIAELYKQVAERF